MKTLQVYLSTIKRCVCVCVCVCVYSVEKNSRTERKSVSEKLSQILQHLNLKNWKKYDRVNIIRCVTERATYAGHEGIQNI